MTRQQEQPQLDALRSAGGVEVSRRLWMQLACAAAASGPVVSLLGGCREKTDETTTATTEKVMETLPGFEPPRVEPLVRVRVVRMRERRPDIAVGEDGQWVAVRDVADSWQADVLRGPLLVSLVPGDDGRSAGSWVVRDSGGLVRTYPSHATIDCTAIDGATLQCADRHFPFRLAMTPLFENDAKTIRGMDVVNHVAIEQYLPGVLHAELYSHWPLATFRAQAVAARSFAANEHAYFLERRHYDMTNTTRSQVYVGHTTATNANVAVRDTAGMLLTMQRTTAQQAGRYEHRLVPGYYSACCGGTAAMARDAIGSNTINTLAPLDGHEGQCPCSAAPRYRWSIKRTQREMTTRLRSMLNFDVTQVAMFAAHQHNAHGRPVAYIVNDGEGNERDLGAERMRQLINASIAGQRDPEGTAWSSSFDVAIDGNSLVFKGSGHGHGVGLCQYGAKALAEQGQDMMQMLQWYYPGANIEQTYGDGAGVGTRV